MTIEGGTVVQCLVLLSHVKEALLCEVCLFSLYLRGFKILKATLFTNPAHPCPSLLNIQLLKGTWKGPNEIKWIKSLLLVLIFWSELIQCVVFAVTDRQRKFLLSPDFQESPYQP